MRKKCVDKSKMQHSILQIHNEKMMNYSDINKNKTLNNLKIEINKNNNEIEMLNKETAMKRVNNNNFKSENMLKIDKLKDKNIKLKKEHDYLESGESEKDYILNTYQYLDKYMILDDIERELMSSTDNIEDKLYDIKHKKNDIIDEYMKVIDPAYFTVRNLQVEVKAIFCQDCQIKYDIKDGLGVCNNCGNCIHTIHHSEERSYKELQEMDYRPQFTYQKATHLDDWLKRFQAKEHKEIPQEILDKVIMEANKQKVKDLSTLTEMQVKKFLKKLELNDYYDNVISIINRINKRKPFVLTAEIENKIKQMFEQIQIPFEKHKEASRRNMLSYSYLLRHFFLILDLPEFSKYFFLLKSPEKLRQQDLTFKKIVDELALTDKKTKWKFFPSN